MDKNVMIPLLFLERICNLLEYWDVTNYDVMIQLEHFDVLHALENKRRKLQLRALYTDIIRADSQDAKDEARRRYIQMKNRPY